MPNEQRLLSTHDANLIYQLSISVCQEIIRILQQHPELVATNYQKINWSQPKYQSALLAGLNKKVSDLANIVEIMPTIKEYLGIFLVRSFFDSPIFHNLETRICYSIHFPNFPEFNHQDDSVALQASTNSKGNFVSQASQAIAILLLDAENLQLNTEKEKILATVCNFPLHVKIAFANWCSMGKRDVELHQRGYELIHVPVGKDNADGKMIAFGSSVHERYPNAKEVLVCSSDKVMTNLCNHLQHNGLIVYRVSKEGEYLTVLNVSTDKLVTQITTNPPELPTIEQFIQQIKELIKSEQKKTKSCWIQLSTLSKSFKSKHNFTISEGVSKHIPGKKARDIFINYPTEFVIHQIDEASEIYVTLFESHQEQSANSAKLSLPPSINSKADLEQAFNQIINELTIKSPGSYINIGILSSKFNHEYGKSITKQIKSLQLSGNFIKFLQSCNSVVISLNFCSRVIL